MRAGTMNRLRGPLVWVTASYYPWAYGEKGPRAEPNDFGAWDGDEEPKRWSRPASWQLYSHALAEPERHARARGRLLAHLGYSRCQGPAGPCICALCPDGAPAADDDGEGDAGVRMHATFAAELQRERMAATCEQVFTWATSWPSFAAWVPDYPRACDVCEWVDCQCPA